MYHQCQRTRAHPLDELREIPGVPLRSVGRVMRTLGQSEAEMIGRDATIVRRQSPNQMPPLEGPGRRAVHEENGLSPALVDIMHPPGPELQPLALEWVLRAVDVLSHASSSLQ